MRGVPEVVAWLFVQPERERHAEDERAARAKHPRHFLHERERLRRVLENLSAQDRVEAVILEGETLAVVVQVGPTCGIRGSAFRRERLGEALVILDAEVLAHIGSENGRVRLLAASDV